MRPVMMSILCALSMSACASRDPPAPEPVVIQQRPPEVLTRCPDSPEPPRLAPLPRG